MKTYKITLSENEYNAVSNAIHDASWAENNGDGYRYVGSMTNEEYDAIRGINLNDVTEVIDDEHIKTINNPILKLYKSIKGTDQQEIDWFETTHCDGINVATMVNECCSGIVKDEVLDIYLTEYFTEHVRDNECDDDFDTMISDAYKFSSEMIDVVKSPAAYGARWCYLLQHSNVNVGIAIMRKVTEVTDTNDDLNALDQFFEGNDGDKIHSSNVEKTNVDEEDKVDANGHHIEMVWYAMKDDTLGNMSALKIDGEYYFCKNKSYSLSLADCGAYVWQSVDKSKTIIVDSNYNIHHVTAEQADVFVSRLRCLATLSDYSLFERYPSLRIINGENNCIWGIDDMSDGNGESYRAYYANMVDAEPLFVIYDCADFNEDSFVAGNRELYTKYLKVYRYLCEHDIDGEMHVTLWDDNLTINIDGSLYDMPSEGDLEWMISYIDKHTENKAEDDIVTKFQNVAKDALDNYNKRGNLEDAGCGMVNTYLECFGTSVIVQCYPHDEYHYVYVLIRTNDIVSDTNITDYPEGMQQLILAAYKDALA